MRSIHSSSVKVRPFAGSQDSNGLEEDDRKSLIAQEHVFAKFLSVRSVFVAISLITVLAMAVGLITLSFKGQYAIANNLSGKIQDQLTQVIVAHLTDLLSWAETQNTVGHLMFYNMTEPPLGSQLMYEWSPIVEHFWTVARSIDTGVEVEFDFNDGRCLGFDNEIGATDEGSNSLNYRDNAYSTPLPPPYPVYPFLQNTSRDYLIHCDDPTYWLDVYFVGSAVQYWLQISCSIFNVSALEDAFVTSAPRMDVHNTDERWIRDVYAKLDGIEDQRHTVSINGTRYLLLVNNWRYNSQINWVVVSLLNYNQFLGETQTYINNSIISTVVIAVVAVATVFAVTYMTTKPLYMLAQDMQKMSRLELDFNELGTPRLMEVKRLYHSFHGMNVALRSFKKFVPMQVIAGIINSKKEVAAELRFSNVTVMFQDIEGFTSLSESMDPMSLAKLTSEFMSAMTDVIVKHRGTIDKYIGDCIMSLFGAPEAVANHPLAAVAAAAECSAVLLEKNKDWKSKYGVEMNFRIGIHTGELLIGNMGSDNRMNYTAFGDNVNIAARLEGVNKYFGTQVIISKQVYKTIPKGQFLTRKLGTVKVSGKAVATSIYEVRPLIFSSNAHLFKLYEEALILFKKRQFQEALFKINDAINHNGDDKPSKILKQRIEETIAIVPLPDDWSHVETLVKF